MYTTICPNCGRCAQCGRAHYGTVAGNGVDEQQLAQQSAAAQHSSGSHPALWLMAAASLTGAVIEVLRYTSKKGK